MTVPFPSKLDDLKDSTFDLDGLWTLTTNLMNELYQRSRQAFENHNEEVGQMYHDQATGASLLLRMVIEATIEHVVTQEERDDQSELLAAMRTGIELLNERISATAYGLMDNMDA